MAEIYKGKKYALTDSQIKGLANICYREQGGGEAGVRACASHMCNYYELYQTKKYSNPYDCTIKSGWYGSEKFNKPYLNIDSAPQSVINYVSDVIRNGNRSIPFFCDEYDCLSDISSATNNGVPFNPNDRTKYKKDITKIKNRYGSSYTFYCFPDGANGYTDAFGYISKPSTINGEQIVAEFVRTNNNSVSAIIEKATKWMENLANNSSHGYDQLYRWGEKGDYDCSSAVITAWQTAGVPVKTNGATYTGDMYSVFIKLGFKDVTSTVNLSSGSGLKRGDILLNHQKHVAMYCGNGKEVEASVNEKGGATGGKPGDQTGKEILIRSYRNYPWNVVLRYVGGTSSNLSSGNASNNSSKSYLQLGDIGNEVKQMQKMLIAIGYYCGSTGADGDFGKNTLLALMKFQSDYGLEVDGLYGKNSKATLTKAYNNNK